MASFLAAFGFLTILPVGIGIDSSQQAISNSRAWFPLVGLLLGLALAGLAWGLAFVFPDYLTAALLVVFLLVVTRALHLDGLMDTCDGLFGGHTPERRREIMRDSHVGAFAVAGAVGVLLLKYAAIYALLAADSPGKEWGLILFPVFSRYAMALQLMLFPYARSAGLGSAFQSGPGRGATGMAALISVAAALLLGGIGGMLILALVSLTAALLGRGITALAGGMTGDTYGATNELTEVLALLAAVVSLPYGLLGPIAGQLSGYL